jgi:hypothetical protein
VGTRALIACALVGLSSLGGVRASAPRAPKSGVALGRFATEPGSALDEPIDVLPVVELDVDRICGLPGLDTAPSVEAGAGAVLLAEPEQEREACWLAGLTALAGARSGRETTYIVGRAPERRTDPAAYAYLLKRAAIALRAANDAASIVSGPLAAEASEWLDELIGRGSAPYLDGIAAVPGAIERVVAARDRLLPAAPVWAVEVELAVESEGAAILRAARALSRRADVVVVRTDGSREAEALEGLVRSLPDDARLSSTVRSLSGEPAPSLELMGTGGARLVVVAPHDGPLSLDVGLPPVKDVVARDASSGEDRVVSSRITSRGSAILRLDPATDTQLVEIRPRADLNAQRVEVGKDRTGLTAEEIIAREREVRSRQNLLLRDYQARARISYHFTIADLDASVDVVSENDAFGSTDAVEYRQTALYVNGHVWNGPAPSFPFIAPDKVKEVPLEIVLNEGYRYELVGEDVQKGHHCYRITFDPVAREQADFKGTVWIDRETFFRVRMDLTRLRATPPVVSDVSTQFFEPVESELGTFRLVTRVEGQMVFSALGHNAVVQRKVRLEDFHINPPEFEHARASALASHDPMFRYSLEEGLVALEPGENGERTVQSASTTRSTLLVGGWNGKVDGSSLGTPFAGINWSDLDWRGKGTQIDVAWGGPFATAFHTWPGSGRGWEVTLEGAVALLPRKDKYSDLTGRVREQDLERLEETVRTYFRRPLGTYATFSVHPSLSYLVISEGDDTPDDYLLPPATWVPGLGFRTDFQRKGYRFALWGDVEHRTDWGPYGLPDNDLARNDIRATPVRYGLLFDKNYYNRRLDRFSIGASVSGGENLDRFSAFQVRSYQGENIRGFTSGGIRYTEGGTLDLTYAFRVGRNLRFEVLLGGGVFRNPEDYGEDWQYAYGSAFAVSFAGPRGTLFRVRTNYGLDSSLPIDGSSGSIRLSVYKTFKGWWPHLGKHPREDAAPAAMSR